MAKKGGGVPYLFFTFLGDYILLLGQGKGYDCFFEILYH